MLSTARMSQGNGKKPGPVISYVSCTALRHPFGNGAFDFVLSVRLSHHIRDHQERIQYAREIMRVSRKWMGFTYFDLTSLKYRCMSFADGLMACVPILWFLSGGAWDSSQRPKC